jgi:hypothetical protein
VDEAIAIYQKNVEARSEAEDKKSPHKGFFIA